MELYATGFNAWRQLDFDRATPAYPPEPDDLYTFEPRLSGIRVGRPVSRSSYTLVDVDGEIFRAGFLDDQSSKAASGGLIEDYRSVVNGHGHVLELQGSGETAVALLTTSGNGQQQLPMGPVKQISAFQAGFAILALDGSVWTCGDERFPHCLAWDYESMAVQRGGWNKVLWLEGIPQGPVVKISAGGYVLGALTQGGDLYVWGQRGGSRAFIEDISDEPKPIDLDADVKDFALGYQHIILVTTDGHIFVRGSNKSGQLGLGKEVEWKDGWTNVNIPLKDGEVVAGVDAGNKTSFILTKRSGHGDGGS